VFGDYRKMMGKLGKREGGKEQIENRHGTRTRSTGLRTLPGLIYYREKSGVQSLKSGV